MHEWVCRRCFSKRTFLKPWHSVQKCYDVLTKQEKKLKNYFKFYISDGSISLVDAAVASLVIAHVLKKQKEANWTYFSKMLSCDRRTILASFKRLAKKGLLTYYTKKYTLHFDLTEKNKENLNEIFNANKDKKQKKQEKEHTIFKKFLTVWKIELTLCTKMLE